MSEEINKDLMTVQEAARFLRVSTITVRRYIAGGRLAAVRVGRTVRIPATALERFMTPVMPQAPEGAKAPEEGAAGARGAGRIAEPPAVYAPEVLPIKRSTDMFEFGTAGESFGRMSAEGGVRGITIPGGAVAPLRAALAEARALREEIRKRAGIMDVMALLEETRQGLR